MNEYACIIIDEKTNSGEPIMIKANSREEARKICREMHPSMKILAVVEVKRC